MYVHQEQQQQLVERYGHHPPLYPHRRGQPMTPGYIFILRQNICSLFTFDMQFFDSFGNVVLCHVIENLRTVGCRLVSSSHQTSPACIRVTAVVCIT